jgi:hypothetical protein
VPPAEVAGSPHHEAENCGSGTPPASELASLIIGSWGRRVNVGLAVG